MFNSIVAITLTEQQQDLLQYFNTNLTFKEGTAYHSTTYDKYDSGMFRMQDTNSIHVRS